MITYVCVYVRNHASLSTDNWIRTCAWGNKTCDGRRDRRNIWDRHFKFGTYGSPFLFFFGWSRILADSALWISERSAGSAPVHTRTYVSTFFLKFWNAGNSSDCNKARAEAFTSTKLCDRLQRHINCARARPSIFRTASDAVTCSLKMCDGVRCAS